MSCCDYCSIARCCIKCHVCCAGYAWVCIQAWPMRFELGLRSFLLWQASVWFRSDLCMRYDICNLFCKNHPSNKVTYHSMRVFQAVVVSQFYSDRLICLMLFPPCMWCAAIHDRHITSFCSIIQHLTMLQQFTCCCTCLQMTYVWKYAGLVWSVLAIWT